jgi:Bacterial regulatory proteins, gntR family
MPAVLISLDQASWRLEKSGIPGRAFAELLVNGEPPLIGLRPGNQLRERVDLSRVTSLRVEPEDVVIADGITWTDVKLDWFELRAAFKRRGHPVAWTWLSNISSAALERSRQPSPRSRFLGDWRTTGQMRPGPVAPQPTQRGRPEWFQDAAFAAAVPASGQPSRGKRGPKSGKRENTAAAIRKDLRDQALTATALGDMPEKELAARYGVSRDTARKARHDALSR